MIVAVVVAAALFVGVCVMLRGARREMRRRQSEPDRA